VNKSRVDDADNYLVDTDNYPVENNNHPVVNTKYDVVHGTRHMHPHVYGVNNHTVF
jgi:hypothetical protein